MPPNSKVVPSLVAVAIANLPNNQKRTRVKNAMRDVEAARAVQQWKAEDAALKQLMDELHMQEQLYTQKQGELGLALVSAQHLAVNANNTNASNAASNARAQARVDAAMTSTAGVFEAMQAALRGIMRLRREIDQQARTVKLLDTYKFQLQFLTETTERKVDEFLADSQHATMWVDKMKQKWVDETAGENAADGEGTGISFSTLEQLMKWAGYSKRVTYEYDEALEGIVGPDALEQYYTKSHFLDVCFFRRTIDEQDGGATNYIASSVFFSELRSYISRPDVDDADSVLTCVSDAFDRMGMFVGEALSMPASDGNEYYFDILNTIKAYARAAPGPERERVVLDFKQSKLGNIFRFILYQIASFGISMQGAVTTTIFYLHNWARIGEQQLPVLFDWLKRGTASVLGFSVWKYYLAHTSGLLNPPMVVPGGGARKKPTQALKAKQQGVKQKS